MIRIGIIGAGLAGLTLARELDGAAEIEVFEKSRGFGGGPILTSSTTARSFSAPGQSISSVFSKPISTPETWAGGMRISSRSIRT